MRSLPLGILLKPPALFRITLPLAGSVILAVAALCAFTYFSAARENRDTLFSEQRIVRSLIERQQSDLGHTLSAYSNWNEAYEKVRHPLDKSWVRLNYGPETIGVQGVDGVYIFDENGRCIYAVTDHIDRGFDVGSVPDGIKALADKVRATHPRDWKSFENSIVTRDGRAQIVSAAMLTPMQESAFVLGDPGRLIVFERSIDDALIHELGQKFNIQGLDQTPAAGKERIVFADPLGRPAASLSWTADRPGTRALAHMLPAVGLVLLTLALANVIALNNWIAMDDAIKKSEAMATAADAANRLKSVLLANISHELRTPLHAIIGFSGLIAAEGEGEGTAARSREHAAHIQKGGTDLLAIVNKLLELARIDRGEKEVELNAVSVQELLAPAEEAIAARAEALGIGFRIETEASLPQVLCDAGATQQILQHLLDNALKFTPRGGKVILSVETDRKMVAFTVSDTGVGIEPDRLAALGSAFATADDSYGRRHGGMGLGLAIAHHLTELQHGGLDLQSETNKGTRAILALPAAKAVRPALRRPRAA